MVNLFGSEKQKRAFSAAKRNVVDEGELSAALATAVSHVKKETDSVLSGINMCCVLHTVLISCSLSACTCVESVSMQSSGLMPPHNAAAESPQDVYNIEDSILADLLIDLHKYY